MLSVRVSVCPSVRHGSAGREAGRTAVSDDHTRPRTTTHDGLRTTTHDHARPPHDHARPRMTTHDHARPPRTTTHDRRTRPRTTAHNHARPPRTTTHDRARPRTIDHGCHICLRKRYLPHPRGVLVVLGVKLFSSTRVSEGTNA